jgi:hypothetical protein
MTTSTIILPTTPAELRDAIKIAIETYHKSPATDDNKLNESLAKSLGYDNYNKLSPLIKELNKPKILGYYIDRDYESDIVTIKNTEINNAIFDGELTEHIITDREDRISCITQYYGEALSGGDPRGDAHLMKDDLDYLESCSDEFVLEIYGTNGFISATKEPEAFNKACDAILEIHEQSLTHVCNISFEGNDITYDATSYENALKYTKEFVINKIDGTYHYDEILHHLNISYEESENNMYLKEDNQNLAIQELNKLNESGLNTIYSTLFGDSHINILKK